MKTIRLKQIVLQALIILAFSVPQIYAQMPDELDMAMMPGIEGVGCHRGIPNLTDEQKDQIKNERLAHQKIMTNLRNQIQEKKAHYNTLMAADNADLKAINQTIDEMGNLKIQMMKQKATHQQAIRKLLTEEQRIVFDSQSNGKHKMGRGMRGCGDCMGQGNYRGQGKHMRMRHRECQTGQSDNTDDKLHKDKE